MNKEKKKPEAKEREKICPLNPGLKCEDCRLYIPFLGGEGQRKCALILAGSNA